MSSVKRRKVSHEAAKAPAPKAPKAPKAPQPRESESEAESSDAENTNDETPPPATTEGDEKGVEAEGSDDEEYRSKTFKELGIVDALCEACDNLGWKEATAIQAKSIPQALAGRDIVGLAETGSGKTGAFALPILQALLDKPQPLFAVILAPTRELATQISQVFEALGSLISLRVALVLGGYDMVTQQIALSKKPHVIVATPGRLLDHLEKTKGFSLRTTKYLVLDEADRMLDLNFEASIDKVLRFIPRERRTYLFSATMQKGVERLQRASLRDPVRVSISTKLHTPKSLLEHYMFLPVIKKDTYLVYILNEFSGKRIIIFTRTIYETQRLAILLRTLGFSSVCLNGELNQAARQGAVNKFRSRARDILVATDVASRGLDIPNVDLVLNFDLPQDSDTYVHRVGRTARANRSGHAISFVSQYDLENYLRIEKALNKKLEQYPSDKDEVMVFQGRVEEAQRIARVEMKSFVEKRGKKGSVVKGKGRGFPKRRHDEMDADEG